MFKISKGKRSDFIRQYKRRSTGLLKESGWVVLNEMESEIKHKIESIGTPLRDWDVQINYGIKTGFNEAFIIDGYKRNELLAKCPKSDEIIRPILLGRNIKRYSYHWEGLWLINAHNGIRSQGKPRADIENDYPAIFDYLKQFIPKIEQRADQGSHWTNLRNCAYLDEFEKPKIVWGNLALRNQFTYVREPMIINNPSNFFVSDNLFLLAVLNSKVADFYIKQLGVTRSGGYFEYKPMFVEQFPIPVPPEEVQEHFQNAAREILNGNSKDAALLERMIDEMTCDLYKLTEAERRFIMNLDSGAK